MVPVRLLGQVWQDDRPVRRCDVTWVGDREAGADRAGGGGGRGSGEQVAEGWRGSGEKVAEGFLVELADLGDGELGGELEALGPLVPRHPGRGHAVPDRGQGD